MPALAVQADQVLLDARCRLITKDPWFGTFASNFDWVADDSGRISTLGVMMKSLSRIQCRYNPEFINKLSLTSNMAAVEHELMHVILLHLMRCGSRNPRLWNIATDMIINGKRENPHIKYLADIEDEAAEIKDGKKIPFGLIWYPEQWPDNLTSEETYERLEQCKVVVRVPKSTCPACGGTGKAPGESQGQDGKADQSGDGQGSGDEGEDGSGGQSGQGQGDSSQGQDGSGCGGDQPGQCPACSGSGQGSGGQFQDEVIYDGGGGETIVVPGQTLDDHDTWSECEVSEDQARQMVKDLCEQTTSQVGVGKVPGKILGAIKKLNEPRRNWKHELRHIIGRKYGGRRRTWSRQNRRRQAFGTKGKSSHASAPLTVCVDTSGSVDQARLEQFFSEIESMSQRFKITLMQFDHGYQCHAKYHRGDWRQLKVQGRGGTSFVEAFKALDEFKLWGRLTIILTDGDAPWPEPPKGHDVLWVIIPHRDPPPSPPFGQTIYIER